MKVARLSPATPPMEVSYMGESESSKKNRAASRLSSFRFAIAGWRHVLRTQPNSRIHAAATVVVAGLGFWLGVGRSEWAILVITIGLVWVAELVNTAIEAVVDLASPESHPLAKVGKDVAAAAVLASAVTAVIVGLLILGPPLWERIASVVGST
jgi:diacylglycerol kinase